MSDAVETSTATSVATGTAGVESSAQLTKNLHTASHLVAAQMGVNPMALTYEQRLQYNRALAIVITSYPARFSTVAVENAQATLKKNFTPLEDTGFDIGAFGSAFADEAIKVGNKIGNAAQSGLDAVGNTFTALKWLLPVIAIGGLGIYVFLKVGGQSLLKK